MSAPEIELPILEKYIPAKDSHWDAVATTGRLGELHSATIFALVQREDQLTETLQALATERAMHELLSRANTEIIQESNRRDKENAELREECETIRGWHKVVRHL